jgi:hypothetical protein
MNAETSATIAQRLLYMYKDHGFVIDASEAAEIFGTSVVVTNTPEYELANRAYQTLSRLERVIREFHSRFFAFAGTIDQGCQLRRRPQS